MTLDEHSAPRLYDQGIDFEALALRDADFASIYHASGNKLDFQDPLALQ